MEQARFFDDLVEGEEFRSPSRTIAECDLYTFAGLTGDLTDFHISTEAARQSVFGRRPAHGMLLIGIANGLYNRIGITDGTGMALTGVDWRFRAPAFIGDTITLVISVERKKEVDKPDRGVVFWAARLVNQNDEVLGDGHMVRMVRREA
jgi:acyl dehydratase